MATKVAVVTGASSGIGEATARSLAREGLRLVLAARREDRLRAMAEELDAEVLPVRCDVTLKKDLRAVVAATEERFGRCDILINSAGVPGRGRFADVDLGPLEAVTFTNYVGLLRATKLFLPMLLEARGHMVNVASLAGLFALPGAEAYAASKHAVVALSESLSLSFGDALKVTAVCPGFVNTEGFPQPDKPRPVTVPLEAVAEGIVDVLRRGRTGMVAIPAWPGPVSALQRLVPGLYRRAVRRGVGRFRR
ncbi:MAG TPA: SDR family NAD(P)-dependent oxidoreductase [Actinomycetota bacterium]